MAIRSDKIRVLSWGLIQAGIIFIPLWVNIFAFNAYENKIYVFIGLVDILLILWLMEKRGLKNIAGCIYNGIANLKLFSLEFLLICYLLATTLATAFSIDFANSFWGNPWRMTGLLFLIHAVLFFFLIKPTLSGSRVVQITRALTIGSIPISIYAILQYFGIDFSNYLTAFVVINNGTLIMRAFSTLGHPNFLAMYLVMILPYSIYSALLMNQNPTIRFAYSLITLVQLLALIFTMTRSAWFAAVISLLLFAFIIYKINGSKRVLTVVVALTVIFVVTAGTIGLKRLEQPIKDSTLSVRLIEWHYAAEQILKRPIFGYGPDNYQILAGQRVPSPAEQKIDSAIADRAHDIIIDTAINIGLVGLLVYLLIWSKVIQIWWRNFKNKNSALLTSATFCSLVGYFIVLLFNFDFAVSTIFFFFNLALLDSLSV
ncbi:MAG: O-antigen ligase family protein [Parcubacteria group bacterium]